MRHRLFALLLGLGLATVAAAQTVTPPPRTVDDVIRRLAAATADDRETQLAREILERPLPADSGAAELARTHLQRGRAAEVLGLSAVALQELRLAVASARRDGGQPEFRMVSELASAESVSGNILSAIRMREQEIPSSAANMERLSNFSVLAHWYASLGDRDGAGRSLHSAEQVLAKMNLARGRGEGRFLVANAQIDRAKGGVAFAAGRYSESEAHYLAAGKGFEASLAYLEAIGPNDNLQNRRGRISAMVAAFRRAARSQQFQGRFIDAEVTLREALNKSVSLVGGRSPITLGIVNDLAYLALEYGRPREAAKLAGYAERTLEAARVEPASTFLFQSRQLLGAALANQGRWRDSIAAFERSSPGSNDDPEMGDRIGLGTKAWILALLRTGQPAAAKGKAGALVAGLESRLDAGDFRLAEARGYLALALAENGEAEPALATFRQSLPLLVARAAGREPGDNVGGQFRRLNTIIDGYISLLHDLHRAGNAPAGLDPLAEAFAYADLARGSVVQQAMSAAAARTAIHDPQLADLARQEQDLSQRIASLQDLLARLVAAPPGESLPGIVAEMRGDLPKLREQRSQLRQRIGSAFPEYVALVRPHAASLADARAQLREGEVLVSLYVGRQRTYVWAVPREGQVAFAAADGFGDADVKDAVARLRRTLDLSSGVDINTTPFDVALAHDLYRRLLLPVEPTLAGGSSLLLAPHRALGQLPFALLITSPAKAGAESLPFAGYRDLPWLIKRWSVAQLPSVATLVALRKFAAAPAAARGSFVGFGDPAFSPAPAGKASPGLQARMARQKTSLRNAVHRDGGESVRLEQLPALPDTAAEVREVARLLQAGDGDVFLAAQASEGRIKGGALANRRVVLLATHGLVPGELDGLGQPALAFASPAVTGETDSDGLLTMEEVLGLRLNADWVVLSACNTAAGEGAGSEAVSGLGRAFFYAGARALLVTHWPVETVSARLLTTDLFRRQAEQPGLARAEALRQSMLKLMSGQAADGRGRPEYAYAHPLFWAPFLLVGEGGSQ